MCDYKEKYSKQQIKDFLRCGSEIYLKFLKKNNKGISKVKVASVIKTDANCYTLFFEQQIQDFSFVTKIEINNRIYPIGQFRYTKTTLTSTMVNLISDDHAELFESDYDIYFIIDFTPLVENVINKYRSKDPLYFPDVSPNIRFKCEEFADIKFSDAQLSCIDNVFNNPISYIWGGAGSGKTKYVLSYSILNYMISDRKVLLVAPTNYALENALSALIEIAKEYKLSPERIARLGTPSMDFAKNFPECCQNDTIEIEIDELNKKINLLNEFIKNNLLIIRINNIEEMLKDYENISIKLETWKKTLTDISAEVNVLEATMSKAKKSYYETSKQIDFIKSQKKKLKNILKSIVKKNQHLENELEYYQKLLLEKKENLNNISDNLKNTNRDLSCVNDNANETKKELNSLEQVLLKEINFLSHLSNWRTVNVEKIKSKIQIFKEKKEKFLRDFENLYNQIPPETIADAKQTIDELNKEIKKLQKQKQEQETLIKVYGCTLDCYIALNFENISHIFLDEACYASVAKTATLFFQGCPITFLGDHMQLPPVAEIDADDLNETNYPAYTWIQNGIYSFELFDLDFEKTYKKFKNNDMKLPRQLSVSALNETYRFGGNLADVLNKHVYKNGFRSVLNTDTQITVVNAPKNKKSKYKRDNEAEAQAIKKYISENNLLDYAVLTPYNEQKKFLHKTMPTIKNKIMTIHKSQGQEWDTVIISISDTHNMFFTDSNNFRGKQLINTAISRARRNLVIVCDAEFWASCVNQLIGTLVTLNNPELANKTYREFYADDKMAKITLARYGKNKKNYTLSAEIKIFKNNRNDEIKYVLKKITFPSKGYLNFEQSEAEENVITDGRVKFYEFSEVVDIHGKKHYVKLETIS